MASPFSRNHGSSHEAARGDSHAHEVPGADGLDWGDLGTGRTIGHDASDGFVQGAHIHTLPGEHAAGEHVLRQIIALLLGELLQLLGAKWKARIEAYLVGERLRGVLELHLGRAGGKLLVARLRLGHGAALPHQGHHLPCRRAGHMRAAAWSSARRSRARR
jgi:hypothetical protein